jgi:hypothetical protein
VKILFDLVTLKDCAQMLHFLLQFFSNCRMLFACELAGFHIGNCFAIRTAAADSASYFQ